MGCVVQLPGHGRRLDCAPQLDSRPAAPAPQEGVGKGRRVPANGSKRQ
nr:MAG TPA: hypothetical protein [Caudoviricetes sp.]